MTGRSVADTVALALKQAALIRDPLPETRALLALRTDPAVAALLGWVDAMPISLRAEYRAAVSDATSQHLAAVYPGTTPDFWEEYLRQRAEGRAGVGLPAAAPSVLPAPNPVKANAQQPKPARGPRPRLPEAEAAARIEGLERIQAILLDLHGNHRMTYPLIMDEVQKVGVEAGRSTLTALGNGYTLKLMRERQSVLSAKKEAEILAALELVSEQYAPKAEAPTASEEVAPVIEGAQPVPTPASVPVAPARIRAPAPPSTDKERRALAEKMGQESGVVDARTFARACNIHMGAAFSALSGYPFLAPARGTAFPYRQ